MSLWICARPSHCTQIMWPSGEVPNICITGGSIIIIIISIIAVIISSSSSSSSSKILYSYY